jgi:hypothetical protein
VDELGSRTPRISTRRGFIKDLLCVWGALVGALALRRAPAPSSRAAARGPIDNIFVPRRARRSRSDGIRKNT